MSNYIPEAETTAFTCPYCETQENENNLAKKIDDHFFCKSCGKKYGNREQANRIRNKLRE